MNRHRETKVYWSYILDCFLSKAPCNDEFTQWLSDSVCLKINYVKDLYILALLLQNYVDSTLLITNYFVSGVFI